MTNERPAILETLQKYITNQDHFPVLNPDAAALQNEILKPAPDISAIKKLVRTDPTLTSEILKAANSTYYKGLEDVSTIKEAMLRMGQYELFNIISRVILRQLFFSKVPVIRTQQKQLWDHSVACAYASMWITRHLKMNEIFSKAYISGLIHDMGKLCLLSGMEKMIVSEGKNHGLTPDLMQKIQDALHPKLGYELLRRWRLPDCYCRIARDHELQDFDGRDPLIVVVRLANMVCHKMHQKEEEDLTFISGSAEADFLGMRETGLALLEIALEDAGLKG